jgi:hypothetical protein
MIESTSPEVSRENPMISKLVLIAAATVSLMAASTAADARHRKWHHARNAPVAHQSGPVFGAKQEPARMIEVKPGLYISSYGCVVDEGYGRYSPCDAGRGSP